MGMNGGMILPSVRLDLAETFLASVARHPGFERWKVFPIFQDVDRDAAEALVRRYASTIGCWLWSKDRIPPYLGRVRMLRLIEGACDVWAYVDDDMVMLPELTDYSSAVDKALQPGVGFVSSNWARSEAFLKHKRLELRFIRQPLVNMAGGMVFGPEAAAGMLKWVPQAYMFDDVQAALTLYLQGFENFRYLGSVNIHRVLMPGGYKQLFATNPNLVKPDPAILPLRPCKPVYAPDNNYYMPDASDLTPLAHQMHRDARATRGWNG